MTKAIVPQSKMGLQRAASIVPYLTPEEVYQMAEAAADGRIRWPSGQVTNLTNVPADQMIEVREGADGYKTLHQGSDTKPKAVEPQGKVTAAWGD